MARYLILERRDDTFYAYFEDQSHFEVVMRNNNEENRKWPDERESTELNIDCDLRKVLKDKEWIRIKVRKSQGQE